MTESSVDDVIRAYLEKGDAVSEAALTATGREGLDRVLDLWFGRGDAKLATPNGPTGKAAVDAQSASLAIVAKANPVAFIDAIETEEVSVQILTILGDIDDPRATTILCSHCSDQDWLLRYNAVASLGRREDESSHQCVEKALSDSHLVVRDKAIEAISHREPLRAIGLYEELLRADGLTPLLREKVEDKLNSLRRK